MKPGLPAAALTPGRPAAAPAPSVWVLLGLGPPVVLAAATVLLTHPLAGQWQRITPVEPLRTPETSLVARTLGSGRKLLSRRLIHEADRFYHQGVAHANPHGAGAPLFAGWAEAIAPSRHQELPGSEVVEIMPWLGMAIGADPSNAQAHATAAYWLMRNGRMDRAIRVLRDGKRKNPGDYRFSQAQAELYFVNGDLELALAEVHEARRDWPRRAHPTSARDLLAEGQRLILLHASILDALGRDRPADLQSAMAAMKPSGSETAPSIADRVTGSADPPAPRPRDAHRHVHHIGCRHLAAPQPQAE